MLTKRQQLLPTTAVLLAENDTVFEEKRVYIMKRVYQNKDFPSTDVPQRQRVPMVMAVLMEREWPLHPFLLRLWLETVAVAVDD